MTLSHRLKGLLLFILEIVRRPRSVGAVFPSSRWLAKQIAHCVPKAKEGFILELGSGTGIITEALLEAGFPAQHIIALERSKRLAEHLCRRFPTIHVIHGDASELDTLLGDKSDRVYAIVSALPLRSLPVSVTKSIAAQMEKLLAKHACLIQFTYSLRKVFPYFSDKFVLTKSHYVWRNLPPARIDLFTYRD